MLNKDFISIEWHIEDVKSRAKERGIKVTDAQSREILEYIERKHDANIGVNWEVIDIWTDEVLNGI